MITKKSDIDSPISSENLKVPSKGSREPLRNNKRFLLPKKKLRIKQSAKEVLTLLTVDFLTPKEIASRRQTSIRAVNKVIRRLKQKGLIDSVGNLSQSTTPFREPLDHQIRLHGQEWNIKLIKKSEKYFHAKQRGNTQFIDGNTIRLFNDSIEIYSGQSFFEKDEQKATALSLGYWERFFNRLEHEFDIIIVKPRSQNIKLVNQHYGEIDSEIANDALKNKNKIRITTEDDGKLWFVIDNSFNLNEMETLHPESAKEDMTKVRKQINDWRLNNPPTNSELSIACYQNAENLGQYAIHLKAHVDSVVKLGNAVEELVKQVKELKK